MTFPVVPAGIVAFVFLLLLADWLLDRAGRWRRPVQQDKPRRGDK